MQEQENESYELFRQAILGRDAEAWAAIHHRYRPLLVSWAWRHSARESSTEECVDAADQALSRAWVALTPERFVDFPTLSRLLGYLRACVMSARMDSLRMQIADDTALSELQIDSAALPEQAVLAEIERSALWQLVLSLTVNVSEQIALIESFVYGLPPRAIHERHPQLFANVADVYSTKRNLLDRLRRNPDLQRLYQDFIAT